MNSQYVHRNREIEEGLLSTCVTLGRRAMQRITINLEPSDFYVSENREVWTVLKKLFVSGSEIDVRIVEDSYRKTYGRELSNALVEIYIGLISNWFFNCTPVHVNDYARILKEHSVSRQSMLTMKQGVGNIENKVDTDDVNTEVITSLSSLREELMITDSLGMGDSFNLAMSEIGSKMSGNIKTVGTGISAIDERIGGFHPGEFIIIAGRPSMGKSDVALNIARNNAQGGLHCQFQSLEMVIQMAMFRLFSLETGVFRNKYRSGELSDQDIQITKEAKSRIMNLSLSIIAPGRISVKKIRSLALDEKARNGLSLLLVDHLSYINASGGGNREQEVAAISGGLKSIAQELNIPVICVSQLSRAAEVRDNPIPLLADLRESGAIEQDADIVIFPFRESYYENRKKGKGQEFTTNPQQDHLDFHVLKHRNGETCVIKDVGYNRGTGHIGLGSAPIVREKPVSDNEYYPPEWDNV